MTASIVVLHYGRFHLTDTCLNQLVNADAEVVLVDNGGGYSHDRADVLVRPAANAGYARGCNLGAAVAGGDTIVFLNNDTEPSPGWLDTMLVDFADPLVGIVGCQLRYPDGRLQHGGVKLVMQGDELAAVHDDSAPLQRRTIPAVTGACMAVRRSAWLDLGGFHEGFWNGYEDVDLCLRAGVAGWRVMYEPEAVVMHHESASGAERWSRVRENIALLQERWLGKVEVST